MALPAHSPGYSGQFMFNADWSRIQRGIGAKYWVDDLAALKVSAKVGGTREVNIAGGYAGGHGIIDFNDAIATVQLPVVATGTRYYMIVLRRTWGVTQASSFTYIDGGTSNTTLPTRNTDPGNTIDDQPLALVPLTAGSSNPGTPIDLRAIGHGKDSTLALSDLVLQYVNWPGARVTINNKSWHRRINAGGTAFEWATTDNTMVEASGGAFATPGSGWSNDGGCVGRKLLIAPGWWLCSVIVQGRRTGATVIPNVNSGNFTDADTSVATLLPGWRPVDNRNILVRYLGKYLDKTDLVAGAAGAGDGSASGYISRTSGLCAIANSHTPNVYLNRTTIAAYQQVRFTDTYLSTGA